MGIKIHFRYYFSFCHPLTLPKSFETDLRTKESIASCIQWKCWQLKSWNRRYTCYRFSIYLKGLLYHINRWISIYICKSFYSKVKLERNRWSTCNRYTCMFQDWIMDGTEVMSGCTLLRHVIIMSCVKHTCMYSSYFNNVLLHLLQLQRQGIQRLCPWLYIHQDTCLCYVYNQWLTSAEVRQISVALAVKMPQALIRLLVVWPVLILHPVYWAEYTIFTLNTEKICSQHRGKVLMTTCQFPIQAESCCIWQWL